MKNNYNNNRTKQPFRKEDFVPVYLKNLMTGDIYVTCKALGRTTIDGVEFIKVSYKGKAQLVRSDSVRQISKEAAENENHSHL
jgi:hypothetical protein